MRKDYLLVDATAFTQQQIEDECNLQAKDSYAFHSLIVLGLKDYLVFASMSIYR